MRTNGQTDGRMNMTKPNSALRDFANEPKSVFCKKNHSFPIRWQLTKHERLLKLGTIRKYITNKHKYFALSRQFCKTFNYKNSECV